MNDKELIEKHIHPSWQPVFFELFSNVRMKLLRAVIKDSRETTRVFPEKFEDIFKIFKNPLESIRCCIIGQDPYPNYGQAIGRSFAVSETTPIPLSLRVMFNEIKRTYGEVHTDRTLQSWEDQGVFLLNRGLTVREKQASSHLEYWRFFTDRIVEMLDVPYLLMGAKAKELNVKVAVKTNHPAVEGYGKLKFTGNNAFLDLNSLLNEKIIW